MNHPPAGTTKQGSAGPFPSPSLKKKTKYSESGSQTTPSLLPKQRDSVLNTPIRFADADYDNLIEMSNTQIRKRISFARTLDKTPENKDKIKKGLTILRTRSKSKKTESVDAEPQTVRKSMRVSQPKELFSPEPQNSKTPAKPRRRRKTSSVSDNG